jgi:hypothetical protein
LTAQLNIASRCLLQEVLYKHVVELSRSEKHARSMLQLSDTDALRAAAGAAADCETDCFHICMHYCCAVAKLPILLTHGV